jgi:16S rRNA (uracil1498-N3)-methyltransferase
MKLHRFLITQKITNFDEIVITDSELNHQLKNVLRLSPNDQIVLLDGKGLVINAQAILVSKKESIFKVLNREIKSFDLPVKHSVKLAPAILKKDKYELVIQKLTELGVDEIHPIVSDRTEKLNLNFERLEKITKEAFEQSERILLPKIYETKNLKDKLEEIKDKNYHVLYLEIEAPKIDINKLKSEKEIFIFIGPEGGWSKADIDLFTQYKVSPVSLGQNVLRAETACLAIASVLMI